MVWRRSGWLAGWGTDATGLLCAEYRRDQDRGGRAARQFAPAAARPAPGGGIHILPAVVAGGRRAPARVARPGWRRAAARPRGADPVPAAASAPDLRALPAHAGLA